MGREVAVVLLLGWQHDGGRRGVIVKTHGHCVFSVSIKGRGC